MSPLLYVMVGGAVGSGARYLTGRAMTALLGAGYPFGTLAVNLVGGLLMGVGGVCAMGCTIGQGISGVSTLALGSFLALAGIVAGGVLGVRYQTWRVERSL